MLVGCTLSQGQADDHPGAAAWDAVDQQFCANPPGTFLHSSDAEMSNGIRPGGHVEAHAVVLHHDLDESGSAIRHGTAEVNGDALGTGMPD